MMDTRYRGDVNRTALEARVPPSNIDAEQALLGAILLNNAAFERVCEILAPEHFYDPVHGQIYEVISKTIQAGRIASPVTIKQYFETATPVSATMTVPQYLGRLAVMGTTLINATTFAQTIRELWAFRQLIVLGEDLVNTAYDAAVDLPPDRVIQEAESRLYAIAEDQPGAGQEMTFGQAADEAITRASEAYEAQSAVGGLLTGLSDLDNKMGGLQPSDLIILAGRPSMGKTALATNIAWHIAKAAGRTGTPVHFFSLEMSSEQLALRILAAEADLASERIRRGKINEDEFRKLFDATQKSASTPLYIDQTGGISIAQLAQRARRAKRQHGTSLFVVDYIQLMSGAKRRDGNRVAEITEITTGLKALAKELNVPILALSQLSRKVEERTDKRPQLSDLKESGSIEQDADVVMFVYREEYYVERQMPSASDLPAMSDWQAKMLNAAGKAEVIIGKQRHGPIGIVPVAFDAALTRFSDLARNYQMPERFQ